MERICPEDAIEDSDCGLFLRWHGITGDAKHFAFLHLDVCPPFSKAMGGIRRDARLLLDCGADFFSV